MKRRVTSFWKKAEWFSPLVCRIHARHAPTGSKRWVTAISSAEIAQATGLSMVTVAAISQQLDWSGIDLPTMRKWLAACNTDFEDPATYRRLRRYMRGTPVKGVRIPAQFDYLRRSPEWKTLFEPLLAHYISQKSRKRAVT